MIGRAPSRSSQARWRGAAASDAAVWTLPLLGVAAALYATTTGIGLTTDSSAYIGAARGLLAGAGVAQRSPQGTMQPMTFYAPLLPVLIAAVARLGIDPVTAARWVNAAAIGVNLLLAMAVIRHDTGSPRWAACGGFVLAVSLPFLRPHSIAWSEPIFFLCSFVVIGALARYLAAAGNRAALLAAGVAAGLGATARYAGAELILAGVIVILLCGRRRWPQRAADAALYAAVSGALPALWMLRNRMVEGAFLRRQLGWHPVPWRRWWSGLGTLAGFLGLRGGWLSAAMAVGALAGAISVACGVRRPLAVLIDDLSPLSRTALLFAAVHVAVLIAAATTMDAGLEFDARLFGPAYVWGTVGAICTLARWSRAGSWTRRDRALLAAALGAFAAAHAATTMPWLIDAHRNGQGYTRPEWRLSDVMERIRHLPADAAVYSDGTAAIDLVLGRAVERLPERVLPITDEPNSRYELELEHMRGRIAASHGVVVYFSNITWMSHVVSADELTRRFGMRVVYRGSDGVMYGLPDSDQGDPGAAAGRRAVDGRAD